MKNKEIEEFDKKQLEELLKRLKDINNFTGFKDGAFKYYLGKYEADLLLSYIEQLEKRNKELYEGFMATQEELTDYATKNEQLEEELKYSIGIVQHNQIITKLSKEKKQLENNRDKAIERCEFWLDFYRNVNNDERIILRLNDILSKLKGDSDA